MATWLMHLRVAEKVKPFLGEVDETAYYVGSIAPDSGRMVGNFTYLPPKNVSHWKREGVSYEQRFEDNAGFFKKYGVGESDIFKRSLFLGYYIHILTDTVYVRDVIQPFIDKNGKAFWRENVAEIRAGWYELDYRFLCGNRNFYPLGVISGIKEFKNEYFDYFSEDDITERIRFAAELYRSPTVHPEQSLLSLNKTRQDELIGEMTEIIINELKNHRFI